MAKERKLRVRTSYELNRLAETNLTNTYEKLVPQAKYIIQKNEERRELMVDVLNYPLKIKGLSK